MIYHPAILPKTLINACVKIVYRNWQKKKKIHTRVRRAQGVESVDIDTFAIQGTRRATFISGKRAQPEVSC